MEIGITPSYSRLIAHELSLAVNQLPRLLHGTGLSVERFLSEDSLLTPEQQIQILRNAQVLSGQPEFGLRVGKRLTPATHGAMGFAASSSPDLLSALRAIRTFLPTRVGVVQLQLQEIEGYLECRLVFLWPLDTDLQRCVAETIVVALLAFGEFIVGRPLYEAEISFTHPKPSYHKAYGECMHGRVRFDCDQLSLRLPLVLCREPNASANHENYLLALQQCDLMLSELQAPNPDYHTRLKKMMLSRSPGTLSEEEAAAALFISKRTLARKLKQENCSFRQIRDEILSRQAADYLCGSQLSVEAIASLMNYHDNASFRRAFKRWYGEPPEQFRLSAKAPTLNT